MDILDIILAKALTPQGKTDTYVAKANKAAAKAEKAEEDAAAAIATVNAAATDIEDKVSAAESLLQTAQETMETLSDNLLSVEDVQAEIKKTDVNVATIEGANANTVQVITTYPDNTLSTKNVVKLYKTTGTNEDGTMTQKAITNNFATKTYVNTAIASIPTNTGGGGGVSNLGADKHGHVVVVGDTGNITAAEITEQQIIELLLNSGSYQATEAVGIEVNYAEKTSRRTQRATNLSMGIDFDQFTMYGGRMRCNVADDGTINAFYGDNNYADDGSNGQVMIYQPKFYYQRIPMTLDTLTFGAAIRRESILISAVKQSGFKLHPIFKNGNEELDYVLLPAYEGTLVNNKLSSIAGSQPITNITIIQAEQYATNRGEGWHITNMAAESANQMLEIVEFGTMNGQEALEDGVSNLTYTAGVNCSALTGSTASLGNASGHATTTINLNNGNQISNSEEGKRAISYRGMENPWGNIWNMIGGLNLNGAGRSGGGSPYICTDFYYSPTTIENNYEYIGFNLPSSSDWISAMGYGDEKYDWVFLPAECGNSANSLLPVGDYSWTVNNLNGTRIAAVGGTYAFKNYDGPFYYACDVTAQESANHSYGARLMYIPTKNATYYSNIDLWMNHMGG